MMAYPVNIAVGAADADADTAGAIMLLLAQMPLCVLVLLVLMLLVLLMLLLAPLPFLMLLMLLHCWLQVLEKATQTAQTPPSDSAIDLWVGRLHHCFAVAAAWLLLSPRCHYCLLLLPPHGPGCSCCFRCLVT